MNRLSNKTEEVNRAKAVWFYPFVFLPERMRTACDRSGANGNGASSRGTRRTDNARGQLETRRFLCWTEDVAAQSESRASSLALPRCSNVTERKHYYAGADLCASREQSQACLSYAETKQSVRSNRVAARLGGGGLKATGSNPGMQERANGLFWESHERVNGRMLQENDHECIWQSSLFTQEYYESIKDIPGRMNACVEFYLNDLYDNLKMLAEEQHQEKDVYFYHSDLTNHGSVVQTLNYLPYGEDWVEFNYFDPNDTTRLGIYRFNGKEKDYESGFHYYGARYHWAELPTGWLSVDPKTDDFPYISPYNYCEQNPIKLKDPDGKGPVFGALIGLVTDYACQVASNLASDKSLGESLTDINLVSLAVSTAEGALTSGGSAIKKIAVKSGAIAVRSVANSDGTIQSIYDNAAQEVVGELVTCKVKIKGPKPKLQKNTTAVAKAKSKGHVTSKQASAINEKNQARNDKKTKICKKVHSGVNQAAKPVGKAAVTTGTHVTKEKKNN